MLSVDFPGVDELRLQAERVRVVGHCTCPCPTIHLAVNPGPLPSYPEDAVPRMIVSAGTGDPRCTHLLLWVDDYPDGRRLLSSVELAWIEGPPNEFPPPEAFDRPRPEPRYFPEIESA
jgi:hypothetical protein